MNRIGRARACFTAKVWEPSFWAFKKLGVFQNYKLLRAQQWDNKETFRLRQASRLAALLRHAAEKIPYYQQRISPSLLADIDKDPFHVLSQWPVLEKKDLIECAEKLKLEMGRGTFPNSTGGSTGTPVILFQDKVYQAASLAVTCLLFDWAGRPPGGPYVKIWGAQRDITHEGQGFAFWLGNVLGNRRILNCFYMTPEMMKYYVKVINGFRPLVVEGYVDGLFQLATFIQEKNLRIACPPRGVVTSAGTLLPHMRTSIEGTFQAPVFDRYGSREVGNVAAECSEHHGLHIMGETSIIEIVDHEEIPLPPGKEGDVLVTNLWNYTMPLVRYRIGDRGVFASHTCRCGRPYPLLQAITGRVDSCFFRKDGGVVSPAFFVHFIGVVHNDGSIREFQVVQKDYSHVVVPIVPRDGFRLEKWSKHLILAEHIRKVMGPDCQVDFSIEKRIEKTPTGKHLYTVCEIN